MSALDQAFIKAYAKDLPTSPPAVPSDIASAAPRSRSAPATRGLAVDQIYHDGSLYRLETPLALGRAEPGLPIPHLPHLPPTSPRRGIRRSLLRFLAGQANAALAPESSQESAPRVSRKVIFRHIAHSAPPPPRGLLRPSPSGPGTLDEAAKADLPPETIQDPPSPGENVPTVPETPLIAPLNENVIVNTDISELDGWSDSAVPAMVVVPESADLAKGVSEALVSVRLDALLLADGEIYPEHGIDVARFAGKSLDDADRSPTRLHIDPPHARGVQGPHVRFGNAAQAAEEAPVTDELSLAEVVEEPLASDLTPQAVSADAPAEQPSARPTVPLWEVDRFQWPKACQKLLADENSYFAHAGEKLAAAVQDGLRVLAITGSRRGEGRTTLSLCLAHAAAKAGIHVAVMEADFARPQLASKLGLDVAYGWQDAALGKIPLSEAAVKSLADGITALPLEPSSARQALSLADPRITATIRAAAATFELVLLDLGPLGPGEELAFPPGERCPLDAAIVVRDLRFATALESDAIGHRLQDVGVEAVGIAENFVVEEQ